MADSRLFSRKSSSRHALLDVLSTYQKLAGSDPHKLRELIVPQEVWRIFVDGFFQQYGRELASYFSERKNPDNYLEMTIRQYCELTAKNPKYWYRSPFMRFISDRSWRADDDNCRSLKVGDLLKLDCAWMPFEVNEPGYLRALYGAYSRIFDFTASVDEGFVRKLHQLAADKVSGVNYSYTSSNNPGEFRIIHDGQFGFGDDSDNYSEAGIAEFLDRGNPELSFIAEFEESDDECCDYLRINSATLTLMRKYVGEGHALENDELERLVMQFCHIKTGCCAADVIHGKGQLNAMISGLGKCRNNHEAASLLYYLLERSGMFLAFVSRQPRDHVGEVLTANLNKQLADYHRDIKAAGKRTDKLHAIIALVQSCEQLHPFIDLNCRTFCMLLLNHLLLRNGFPIAMLDNPNRFDLYSREELFHEVVRGMQNTFTLINTGALNNVNTKDVLKFLKMKFPERYEYFRAVVDIEINARAALGFTRAH